MMTAYPPDPAARALLLQGALRQLHRETDRLGAADLLHQLRNAVLTAQGALHLVEQRLRQGRTDELDTLLDLAEARVRESRMLVARIQGRRFQRHSVGLHAA